MTLTRYNEIMDRVTVTPEMRERVLTNAAEAAARPVKRRASRKLCLAIAACLALVLLGSLTLPRLIKRPGTPTPTGVELQQGGWEMAEYDSAEALSAAAGFAVRDVPALAAASAKRTCSLIGGDLAEIAYPVADAVFYYRVSPGSGDNSGDYNEYASVRSVELGGVSVTFKGDAASCCLAIWEEGGSAYSLSCPAGVPYAEMEGYVLSALQPS